MPTTTRMAATIHNRVALMVDCFRLDGHSRDARSAVAQTWAGVRNAGALADLAADVWTSMASWLRGHHDARSELEPSETALSSTGSDAMPQACAREGTYRTGTSGTRGERELRAALEQRTAELAVVNAVQQALAAELDMQGIYEAVGDKIREISTTPTSTFASFIPTPDSSSSSTSTTRVSVCGLIRYR